MFCKNIGAEWKSGEKKNAFGWVHRNFLRDDSVIAEKLCLACVLYECSAVKIFQLGQTMACTEWIYSSELFENEVQWQW